MSKTRKTETLLRRLADLDLSQESEQGTREIVVNRLIDTLGWDTLNNQEVVREHAIQGGKVDYCLCIEDRNYAFIEVKRAGTILADVNEEQLLRYAFSDGGALAVLTNGIEWWLYLPTADVDWEKRRFFDIDIRENRSITKNARSLHQFLSRENLANGSAYKVAQDEFKRQKEEREARIEVEKAWGKILSVPDDVLVDLITETVEESTGRKPKTEIVIGFLNEIAQKQGVAQIHRKPKSDDEDPPKPPPKPAQKVTSFRLDRKIHEATTWPVLLKKVAELLIAGKTVQEFVEQIETYRSGKKGTYLSTDKNLLRRPLQILNYELWINTNYNSETAKRLALEMVNALRGQDNHDFEVQLKSNP